jgi:hypothetical protein
MAVTLTVHKLGLDTQFLGTVINVHSARHLQKREQRGKTIKRETAANSTDFGRG